MALLVIIVMSALLTILTASVVAGQRQTRFDENFEQSLQVAESGLDRAAVLVQQRQQTDDFCIASTAPTTATTGCSATPAVGGWVVTADKDATGDWVLTSTGDENGTLRTLEQDVNINTLFNLAAFGKFFLDFNGGNGADSYRAGTWNFSSGTPTYTWTDATATTGLLCNGSKSGGAITDPTAASQSDAYICAPRATGNGVVATNGELKLKGQVADATDKIEIHYAKAPNVADPLPGATGYCDGVPQTCSKPPSVLSYHRDPIELPEPVPPCSPTSVSFPNASTPKDGSGNYLLAPGIHCFANVTMDADGAGGAPDVIIQGDALNPTRVYLTGTLKVENAAVINFKRKPDGNYLPIPRPPASLLIFSTGTGPTLTFGNHAAVSAAIYAPSAAFGGGSQGNIFGSLVAGSINNNGGWNFHYDESLADVTDNAPLVGENWREE